MRKKDEERVKRAASTRGGASQAVSDDAPNRANQRGEGVSNGTMEDLDQIAEQLGNTWSDYVQFRAFQRMTENLQTGRRGDELQEFINGLKYGVSRAIALTQGEIGQELDPKFLLKSNPTPTPTLTQCSNEQPMEVEAVEAVEENQEGE